jgi:hypothetical protein
MRFLALCPALLFATVVPCAAATYFVATGGSDDNPGDEAQPFRTVTRGAAALAPGDTLYVKAGTYPESFHDAIPGGASWSAPVTLAAYPGDTVVLQPQGVGSVFYFSAPSSQFITISGFTIDGRFIVHDAVRIGSLRRPPSATAHDIRFQDSEIRNAPVNGVLVADRAINNRFTNLRVHHNGTTNLDHGFYISTSGNVVEHSEIFANSGEGVQIYSQHLKASVDENVVRYNRLHDNGVAGTGCGMILSSGRDNLAYDNVVWNNRCGIRADYGAVDPKIYNNTVVENAGTGILAGKRSQGALIVNNISYLNAGGAITLQGRGGVANHNLINDPWFVDPGALDFHLAAGSPAIDAGAPLAEVPDDADGVLRPQGPGYDIGAYEFVPTPH